MLDMSDERVRYRRPGFLVVLQRVLFQIRLYPWVAAAKLQSMHVVAIPDIDISCTPCHPRTSGFPMCISVEKSVLVYSILLILLFSNCTACIVYLVFYNDLVTVCYVLRIL